MNRPYPRRTAPQDETPGQTGRAPAGTGSAFFTRLSPRDQAVIQTVLRFRQCSADQLRRLHFAEGTKASQRVKQTRSLARLTRQGHVQRLPRLVGGWGGGSTGYIYLPPGSRTRIPDPHTLDICELYVRLNETSHLSLQAEADVTLLAFDPEPYCHVQLGHLEIKPDSYLRLRTDNGTFRYWLEIDRGTEWRPQLNAKMKRYNQAYHHWQEPIFPQVVFIVPDELRQRLVESVIKRQDTPGLFACVMFENAIDYLT